uniref:Secreted protein n=1 Tax=Arundo donax TaxID=35708 RepID=A0A0A9B1A4_ARUDO
MLLSFSCCCFALALFIHTTTQHVAWSCRLMPSNDSSILLIITIFRASVAAPNPALSLRITCRRLLSCTGEQASTTRPFPKLLHCLPYQLLPDQQMHPFELLICYCIG